ncbi:hypothetical protein ABB37_03751 [Leptomonas pyrrhocoris]|uniref:Uncharacterized protein n=1 Tax=Leptomonas pyrrhocoris TaxID=157538 RepID=A0A0N0VFJ8_LEPPY|nr:hypothetical protein ABB37_03751 [Leptomonas pyrrhocoris]KPA81371.1 hypothetical protein ABB37_03751 [Leptomonas pyrrhocoris]|eukprot:XP_015659810.1 hypothetical protein ABB37_03751 [Leptomonas pyrrhocoris]
MSTDGAFEAFCATHALQQQREGVEVPSKLSRSFSYYQWLEVAKQKFHEAHADVRQGEKEPELKKVKIENGAVQSTTSPPCADNALADAIAQLLTSSLQTLASPSTAPPSLRHADQEAFPTPSAAAGMPAFLTLAEAAMRLTLWHPQDAQLAQLAARMRPNLRSLEERGIIRTQDGCFPGLQLLMDLLSWRIIAHRWARLTPEMRQVAVDGVQTLCSSVVSPAADELRLAIQQLDVSSNSTSVPITQLDSLVGQVSAAIPFQFAACRDLVTLYAEPTGVLRLPKLEQSGKMLPAAAALDAATEPATSSDKGESSVGSGDEDSVVRVGDLVGDMASTSAATATTTAGNEAVAPSTTQGSRKTAGRPSPYVGHPVLEVVPRASRGQSASTNHSTGTRRMPAKLVNGHPACVSQYHKRYADASKHASSECRYCATCHLMEILFRGEKRDCVWRHWPTTRKIEFHLKRFPDVLKLALKRFGEMARGMQLAATDEVPL